MSFKIKVPIKELQESNSFIIKSSLSLNTKKILQFLQKNKKDAFSIIGLSKKLNIAEPQVYSSIQSLLKRNLISKKKVRNTYFYFLK